LGRQKEYKEDDIIFNGSFNEPFVFVITDSEVALLLRMTKEKV